MSCTKQVAYLCFISSCAMLLIPQSCSRVSVFYAAVITTYGIALDLGIVRMNWFCMRFSRVFMTINQNSNKSTFPETPNIVVWVYQATRVELTEARQKFWCKASIPQLNFLHKLLIHWNKDDENFRIASLSSQNWTLQTYDQASDYIHAMYEK